MSGLAQEAEVILASRHVWSGPSRLMRRSKKPASFDNLVGDFIILLGSAAAGSRHLPHSE